MFKLLIISIVLFWTPKSYAKEPFETQYNITYDINKDGETVVTHEITIINKENDVIATNYSLSINQANIYDSQASDRKGKMQVDTKIIDNTTEIKTKINDPIIGEGKKSYIKVSYKSKEIAVKVGSIRSINIPLVNIPESTTKYDVIVNIPDSFGPEIFFSPQPKEISKNSNQTSYMLYKELINNKSINGAFGNYQTLNFKLGYHLKNSSFLPGKKRIALPPEVVKMQQVNIKSVIPSPSELEQDEDGNTIASYLLWPRQDLKIEVVGSARLLGRQIQTEQGGKMKDTSKDLINNYTKQQKYWESDSVEIKKLAGILANDHRTVSQNAAVIYEYITKHLEYNKNITKETVVERKGALTALKNSEAGACMEFTDLFIAIARAMGIPARELNGFAFSNDSNLTPVSINLKSGDVLHAWPEYYDPNFGWVAIDPTWGTTSGADYFTKLDTNHFVFSIKGLNSEQPLPAGTYKQDYNEKQVEVDFAQDTSDTSFEENLTLSKKLTVNPIKILKGEQLYELKNETGMIISNINNTGKNLLPWETYTLYLPKDTNTVKFTNINGVEQTKKVYTE